MWAPALALAGTRMWEGHAGQPGILSNPEDSVAALACYIRMGILWDRVAVSVGLSDCWDS